MDQPSSTESSAITLRIKFKSASLDDFINRYGVDVSPGGIFIRTKQPVEVGTTLQFEFSLADGSPLLTGTGTVAWVRENDPGRPNNVPGMGLRFDKLVPESQHTHQAILAEKARKEGKASGTPYPPTSSVVPATRPSDVSDVARAEPAKAVPTPENLASTRPAPASIVNPSAIPFGMPAHPAAPPSDEDDDEFDGGKTEISDRPLDFFLKDAAREAEAAQLARNATSEQAVPSKLIDEPTTDAVPASNDTGAARASVPEPLTSNLTTESGGFGEKTTAASRKSAGLAALMALGNSDERAPESSGAPSEVLEEISAGAPIEETAPEKTEEVSMSAAGEKVAEARPVESGVDAPPFNSEEPGAGSLDDRPPSEDDVPAVPPKGGGKKVAVVAVLAAAAAFAAVYLAKARPWQAASPAPSPVAATPTPAVSSTPPAPAVQPSAEPAAKAAAAAEPSKPAAEEPAKPSAELKAVAADKAEPEKKPADKAEKIADKASDEKPAAKPEAESSTKSTNRKSAKSAGEEKPTTGEQEAIYRLVFRSTPLGAEVLIDGEYYARTPCERRILDPNKSYAITVRKQGYEPHERMLGPSDNWVKKGNERVLSVAVSLKRASAAAGDSAKAADATQPKAAKWSDTPATDSKASPASAEPKPSPKAEAAKPAMPPEEKPSLSKPAPSFDEPAKKAKE